jgi:hypothetical protein
MAHSRESPVLMLCLDRLEKEDIVCFAFSGNLMKSLTNLYDNKKNCMQRNNLCQNISKHEFHHIALDFLHGGLSSRRFLAC